jgi:hypothetical protein
VLCWRGSMPVVTVKPPPGGVCRCPACGDASRLPVLGSLLLSPGRDADGCRLNSAAASPCEDEGHAALTAAVTL